MRFVSTPGGGHHGELNLVALVYDDKGAIVNSASVMSVLDFDASEYTRAMKSPMALKLVISVPIKGDYFFRFGVHDKVGDRTGALEIPVDNAELGVAGPGQTLTP
jgi:hypothetical protein